MGKKTNLIKKIFKSTKKTGIKEILAEQEPKEFSFETLSSATEDFHAKNKFGKGGFAEVYKGKLNDGREIAVKKPLQISDKEKELVLNEMKLLWVSAHHRNIVKFLGSCSHDEDMLLVFEFASNGSLHDLVFKTGREGALDWKKTYDIIVGVAQGLFYLHEQSQSVIIHCDIKPANILIDENWVPKIADFGMARLLPQDHMDVIIDEVAGTFGYMAPEYGNGFVSPKADIYSFGVVVLELISGEKNWPSEGEGLLDRAKKLCQEGNVLEFVDQKLIPLAVRGQVELCVQIGVMCTECDSERRPTMAYVYSMLSEKQSSSSTLVEEPVRDGSSSSTARNSRPTELANNGSSSGADIHVENEGLPKNKQLTRTRRIKEEDVQSYPSIPSSSCSSVDGPTELANNGSSSGADINVENEGLPQNRRLTRTRRFKEEDVQP